MPYQFDENKYKSKFDSMFGSGSFESGLSSARNKGRLKAETVIAKKKFNEFVKQKKKDQEYQDKYGMSKDEYDMNKEIIKQKRAESKAFVDKSKKEGRGGYLPDREYALAEEKKADNAKIDPKKFTAYNKKYDPNGLIAMGLQKPDPKKKSKPKKKEKGVLDKTKDFFTSKDVNQDGKRDGILGLLEKIDRPGDAVRTGIKEAAKGHSFWKGAKDGFTGKKDTSGTEVISSLGFNPDKNKLHSSIANFVARGFVSELPGMGLSTPAVSKKLNNKIGKETIGIGSEMVLDPLNLVGAGVATKGAKALSKLGKLAKGAEKVAEAPEELNRVLSLPAPQKRLNAPQLQLEGPKPVNPSMDTFNNAFKSPKLSNPIPEIPSAMKRPIIQKKLEDAGLGFAESSKYAPKARKPVYETNHIDPLKRPQEYWQQRYEDFVQHAHESGYNENNLSHDAINELWTHFAKHDEPVSIDQVVELAYPKGYEAPPKPTPPTPEHPLKTALKNDPVITEKVKALFPPVRPEPKISRLATLDEMVKNLENIAPPKQMVPEPMPLQFSREKGFNPNLKPNILNRDKVTVSPVREQYENISAAPKGSAPKEDPITKPQDEHGFGLIDTKAEKQAELDKLLKYSHNWKDKAKFALKRETMVRNFEDIMGKDAPKMKYKYLNNIGKSEAESVRFKNAEREQIGKYKIKAYSKDSALAQMYGEGKISLDELKAQSKNWKDVVKLTEHLRKKYDEWLPQMNKALQENGFDPVPYRKNYFPHMEDLSKFEKFLRDNVGIDMTDNTLPTEINGRTAQFKPGKQFFRNALQRKGDETAFDAVLGADKYLEGMSNVVYHTKNIKQLRDLANGLRGKFDGNSKHLSNFVAELDEFANNLAGKKAVIDRAVEDTFGRKAYNVVDTLRRKVGVNMVGANLGSALTNFIPLTQSLAATEKKAFVKGLTETMANILKDKDGFVNKSDFLTRRMGSDPLSQTLGENIANKSMVLMRGFDRFTSQVIVRSKYNELIKTMPEERAIRKADEWAAKVMADRSKGSMPTLFNSKTLGLFSQFQLEVNNQLSHLVKDLPRDSKSKAQLVNRYAQVLLYSYLFNNLYEKAVGRRPAIDPIGIAFQAEKDYNNDHISNGKATKNLTLNVLNALPFTSVIAGGRIPIGAAIPNPFSVADGKSSLTKESLKPLTYLVPPAAGSQIKKTIEGLTAMGKNPLSPQQVSGEYTDGGKLRYPIENSVPNNLRAALFGKSSLPETSDYYDNSKKPLSSKQTAQVEQSSDPMATFKQISQKRSQETILNKIKKVQKSNMSEPEKAKNLQKLLGDLQKLREGK